MKATGCKVIGERSTMKLVPDSAATIPKNRRFSRSKRVVAFS